MCENKEAEVHAIWRDPFRHLFTHEVFQTPAVNDVNEEYDYTTGITIKSENGSTIWAWHASVDNWGSASLVKWDGVYFIVTIENIGGDYDYYEYTWYRINQAAQSITQLDNPVMSVRPSVVNKSQVITVELDENYDATEIIIVNAVGQTIKRIPVQTGQREVQLNASDLGTGIHIMNARSKKRNSSYKIIVD